MGFIQWVGVFFFFIQSANIYKVSTHRPGFRFGGTPPPKAAYTLHLLLGRPGNCHAIYKSAEATFQKDEDKQQSDGEAHDMDSSWVSREWMGKASVDVASFYVGTGWCVWNSEARRRDWSQSREVSHNKVPVLGTLMGILDGLLKVIWTIKMRD